MHQFTNGSVLDDKVFVDREVVTLYPAENYGYVDLSKEDLLHLLKLIEENE